MMSRESPLILLVDDDVDFLEMNRHVLRSRGYRVMTAQDTESARACLSAAGPDLVITDLMMSRLDSGFSFARFVKEDPRFQGTPVIILTSVTSRTGLDFHPKTPEDLAAMHVDAYFDKPVSPLALVEKVRELLRRKCPTANGE